MLSTCSAFLGKSFRVKQSFHTILLHEFENLQKKLVWRHLYVSCAKSVMSHYLVVLFCLFFAGKTTGLFRLKQALRLISAMSRISLQGTLTKKGLLTEVP